ncbi:MAG: glycosyltransferase family 4 protein [Micromonosporaceae bacterium]
MPKPLCVLLPEIGVASETFLRWDVQRLLPGGTVVVADPPPRGETVTGVPTWDAGDTPRLVFGPLPGDPPPSLARQNALLNFLAEHDVEVVLAEYFDFADRWFELLLKAGVRVWVRGHGIDMTARLREPRWRRAYRRFAEASGLIVPSNAAAGRLVDLGLPSERVHVIRFCVDAPAVPPSRRRRGPDVRCVAVGRLVEKKAPLLLLKSFHAASAVDPRLTLDLVGDGPLMADVRRFISARRLGRRVKIHGRLPHDQTLSVIGGADLFLHHAVTADTDGDGEGQPLSILEAMAAGLPVIATHHEGIPEIVANQVSGHLVAERDVAAMSHAILALAGDPVLRHRLGVAAWSTIRSGHTEEHVRTRLLDLLALPKPTQVPAGAW